MPRWRRRRRWCDVVSTVYVPALLERCRERAAAERLAIEFRQADAEALPFAEASFDSMSMLAGRRAVVHHTTPKGDFS
jgi:ubiquinone/menaquinone biosynthesis C-methylase UbiE